MLKFKTQNLKLGFTLIELLVVISIIGVLATLVLANVQGVRERGRDAARKSDIKSIQQALEMYKNAQSSSAYPPTATWQNALTTGNFIQTVPVDPMAVSSGWPAYSYTLNPSDSLKYTLIACLENNSDTQKDGTVASYCSNLGKTTSFTKTEP